jgi:hypothetical protein
VQRFVCEAEAFGCAASPTTDTPSQEGGVGPWVLVSAIGLGLTFVLLIIGVLAGLSALSNARARRRGGTPVTTPVAPSHLPALHRPGPMERRRTSARAADVTPSATLLRGSAQAAPARCSDRGHWCTG